MITLQLCFPTNGAQIKSGFQASCVNVAPGGTSLLHLEHFNTSNSKIKHVLSLMAVPSQNHNPLHLFPGQICTFQQREKKEGEKKQHYYIKFKRAPVVIKHTGDTHTHDAGDQQTPKVAKRRGKDGAAAVGERAKSLEKLSKWWTTMLTIAGQSGLI